MKVPRSFVAKYNGKCHECWVPIEPGDVCTYDTGSDTRLFGSGGWVVHLECPDPASHPGGVEAYDKQTQFTGTTLEEMGY